MTIRSLLSFFPFVARSNAVETEWAVENMIENNLKISGDIEVLSTYYGGLHGDQRGAYIDAEASKSVKEGDLLLLILTSSGGYAPTIPPEFTPILTTELKKRRSNLTLSLAYTKYTKGSAAITRIFRESDNMFASLITLRGAEVVVDAKGFIDPAGGLRGYAFTPRVKTAEEGCLVTAFLYREPHKALIEGQYQLVSFINKTEGLAIGISETHGGCSKRIKARGKREIKGTGEDLAVAIALY
jgi:hypothetical protein